MIWKRETFALVPHDGQQWLCVKYETTYSNKPVVVAHYWPIMPVSSLQLETYYCGIIGSDAFPNDTSTYTWKRPGVSHYSSWESFRLIDGGQTKPILTTETPLLQPKARKGMEARYHNGWWQKYTKKYGWENMVQAI